MVFRITLAALLVAGAGVQVWFWGMWPLAWHLPGAALLWWLLVHRPMVKRREGTCELCKLDL